jgi:hypothetical protein
MNGYVSNVRKIGLSIDQGSGTGPTLYFILKSDLRTVSYTNDVFMYANYTSLLVPGNTDV